MANYAFTMGKPLPVVPNGTIFERINFHRLIARTKIFEGITGLTFRNCNLINCSIPVDAVIEYSNNCQVEYCSNLHPEFIPFGLAPCVENCSHVIGTDTVQVQGATVATVYHYADKDLT